MLEFLFYLKPYKAQPRVDSNNIDPPKSPAGNGDDRRPKAETGRSRWGCDQQDARAAQGTRRTLGTATRVPCLYAARRNPPAPAKKKHLETQVFGAFLFLQPTGKPTFFLKNAKRAAAQSSVQQPRCVTEPVS